MDSQEILREQIFEVVENQLRDNNPPETKIAYDRLKNLGYNEFQIKQMIGQCVATELFFIGKEQKPFNLQRYIKNLQALPKEPFD